MVVDIGLGLKTQAETERDLRPDAPVVLREQAHVKKAHFRERDPGGQRDLARPIRLARGLARAGLERLLGRLINGDGRKRERAVESRARRVRDLGVSQPPSHGQRVLTESE